MYVFFCADCRISEKIINVQCLIRACRLEKILKINKPACMAITGCLSAKGDVLTSWYDSDFRVRVKKNRFLWS